MNRLWTKVERHRPLEDEHAAPGRHPSVKASRHSVRAAEVPEILWTGTEARTGRIKHQIWTCEIIIIKREGNHSQNVSSSSTRIKTTRSDKWVGRQITCSARSIYGGIVVCKYSTRRHVIIGKSKENDRPPKTPTRHTIKTGPKEEYSPTLEGTRQDQSHSPLTRIDEGASSPDDAETATADTSITTPNANPTRIPSQTRFWKQTLDKLV